MIRLRSILLETQTQPDDLHIHNRDIQQWRSYWFRTKLPMRQSLLNWRQRGILSDVQYDDVLKSLDDLDEFFKTVSMQSIRLLGGGIGPRDFADGP